MSETIATLIRKGWIERVENPQHRRILMTRLTESGEALLAECETAVDAMEENLLAGHSRSDIDSLRRSLRAIVKAG